MHLQLNNSYNTSVNTETAVAKSKSLLFYKITRINYLNFLISYIIIVCNVFILNYQFYKKDFKSLKTLFMENSLNKNNKIIISIP